MMHLALLLILPCSPVDNLLETNGIPPADGFDFPVGSPDGDGSYTDQSGNTHDGWRVSTRFGEVISVGVHPGEDWNGTGGGNTDEGQPVYAIANGKVRFAQQGGRLWGNIVIIEHIFYENHHKKSIHSLYAHLGRIDVRKGQTIRRRTQIGTIGRDPDLLYWAHLHLELRLTGDLRANFWPASYDWTIEQIREAYAEPSTFIRSHRQLFVPQDEKTLVIVDHQSYQMRIYQDGKMASELPVSFGQTKGQKERRGDNRTPKGMYFVVNHHRGKMQGKWAAYYGDHWIKLNYPNPFDAKRGVEQALISNDTARSIESAWRERRATAGNTKLGGGIGFHGWIEPWAEDGARHLSWGCIVMQTTDIAKIYDAIPIGTMVIII